MLLAVGSFAGGGWLGYRMASGDAARKDVAAFRQAHARAVDNAIDDRQRAIERARASAQARQHARVVFVSGVKDAGIKSRLDCGWDPESLGLLYRAIDAANGGSQAGAGGLPDAVPEGAEAGGRIGPGDPDLGV